MKSFRFLLHSLALVLVFSLALLTACAPGESAQADEKAEAADTQVVEADFQAMIKDYQAAENEEGKLKAITEFLTKHPDSDKTSDVLNAAVRMQFMRGENGPDLDGAVEFVKGHIARVKNPENLAATKTVLLRLYADAEKTEEIKALLAEMGDPQLLPRKALEQIYPVARKAEMWDVAIDYAKATVTKLDGELAEADPADINTTRMIKRSKGFAMEALGASLAGKGELDEALNAFADAEKSITFNFAGNVYGEFRDSWASALLQKKDYSKAMEVLTPDAVFLSKPSSLELYKEAFVAAGNKESQLAAHIERQRKELARKVPEFTVFDYQGNPANFSDLKGEVTLLAFWFPT